MLSKKGSTKKPKNVIITATQNCGATCSSLDLHEDQEIHKTVPSLKKYQSSDFSKGKNLNINDEQVFEMLFKFLERLVEDNMFCCELL